MSDFRRIPLRFPPAPGRIATVEVLHPAEEICRCCEGEGLKFMGRSWDVGVKHDTSFYMYITYITLHYITLPYLTLHYITLHTHIYRLNEALSHPSHPHTSPRWFLICTSRPSSS